MYGCVYRVTHEASGLVYIGQTVRPLAKRWRDHQKQPCCVLLHRALKKHGPDAFTIEQLCAADSKLQLDLFERFWISVYQATDRAYGYNLKDGGSRGRPGAETRKKMSERMLLEMQDPARRQTMADVNRGKKVAATTRSRLATANTGKRHSDDTVAALSNARREMWEDPAYREAVMAAQNAGKRTAKARAAAAEKSRAQWADPEKRKKLLEALAAGKSRAKAARERT